jgi:WD40 repeat protein
LNALRRVTCVVASLTALATVAGCWNGGGPPAKSPVMEPLPAEPGVKTLEPIWTPLPEDPPIRFKRLCVVQSKSITQFLEFSSDGKLVAGERRDSSGRAEVVLWDTSTGMEVLALRASHPSAVPPSAAFIPPGDRIVTPNWGDKVNIWDVETGRLLATLDPGPEAGDWTTIQMGVLPDGTVVAHDKSNRFFVGNPTTGTKRLLRAEESVRDAPETRRTYMQQYGAAYAPRPFASTADGSRFATDLPDGSDNPNTVIWKIVIWDAKTFRVVRVIATGGSIYQVAYAPDGSTVAAVYYDPSTPSRPYILAVWDPASGKKLLAGRLADRELYAKSLAYTRDGKYLLVNDHPPGPPFFIDGSRRLGGIPVVGVWEVATGRLVNKISVESLVELGIAVSPDNKLVAVPGRTIYAIEYAEQAKGK